MVKLWSRMIITSLKVLKEHTGCNPYRNINLNAVINIFVLFFLSRSIKREKRPPSPEDDDVIILSDNESPSPPMNGLSHFKELDTDLLMVRDQSQKSCFGRESSRLT